MKMKLLVFTAASAALACAAAQTPYQPCVFYDPDSGVQFDLSSLAQTPYFDYSLGPAKPFRFTFCKYIDNFYCGDNDPTSTSALNNNGLGCFKSYGKAENASWRPLSGDDETAGISLVYNGGPSCDIFGTSSWTTFNLGCDKSMNALNIVNLVTSEDGCGLTYTLTHAAGCGVYKKTILDTLGVGWIVFLVFLTIALVYVGGGMLYKRRKYGSSGFESIPNIELWRKVWGYAVAGVTLVVDALPCSCLGRGKYARTTGDEYHLSVDGEADGGI